MPLPSPCVSAPDVSNYLRDVRRSLIGRTRPPCDPGPLLPGQRTKRSAVLHAQCVQPGEVLIEPPGKVVVVTFLCAPKRLGERTQTRKGEEIDHARRVHVLRPDVGLTTQH